MPYEEVLSALKAAYSALVGEGSSLPHDKLESVSRWLCGHGRSGLLLYGGYGLGKTTMLKAIRYVYDSAPDRRALHFTARRFVENYSSNGSNICAEKTLLMIDELGREFDVHLEYGNATEPVTDLICYREDRNLPTILASNLTDEELKKKYGPYVYDRLFGSYNRIFFDGKSFRGR